MNYAANPSNRYQEKKKEEEFDKQSLALFILNLSGKPLTDQRPNPFVVFQYLSEKKTVSGLSSSCGVCRLLRSPSPSSSSILVDHFKEQKIKNAWWPKGKRE